MWAPFADFYAWSCKSYRVKTIPAIRFELIDVHWQPERCFVVPEGPVEYFCLLKQYVWDLFWMATHLGRDNGEEGLKVLVMPVLPIESLSGPDTSRPG